MGGSGPVAPAILGGPAHLSQGETVADAEDGFVTEAFPFPLEGDPSFAAPVEEVALPFFIDEAEDGEETGGPLLLRGLPQFREDFVDIPSLIAVRSRVTARLRSHHPKAMNCSVVACRMRLC